jgi:hypothetical protein
VIYLAAVISFRSDRNRPRSISSVGAHRKEVVVEDIWQLHFSIEGGKDHNASDEFITNPDGPDAANFLQLNGNSDGSFSVFISRTEKTKRYSAR